MLPAFLGAYVLCTPHSLWLITDFCSLVFLPALFFHLWNVILTRQVLWSAFPRLMTISGCLLQWWHWGHIIKEGPMHVGGYLITAAVVTFGKRKCCDFRQSQLRIIQICFFHIIFFYRTRSSQEKCVIGNRKWVEWIYATSFEAIHSIAHGHCLKPRASKIFEFQLGECIPPWFFTQEEAAL